MKTKTIVTVTLNELKEGYKYYLRNWCMQYDATEDIEIIIDDISPQEIERNKEITNEKLGISREKIKWANDEYHYKDCAYLCKLNGKCYCNEIKTTD